MQGNLIADWRFWIVVLPLALWSVIHQSRWDQVRERYTALRDERGAQGAVPGGLAVNANPYLFGLYAALLLLIAMTLLVASGSPDILPGLDAATVGALALTAAAGCALVAVSGFKSPWRATFATLRKAIYASNDVAEGLLAQALALDPGLDGR